MKLTIKGKPKEIAALLSELQGRQRAINNIMPGNNKAKARQAADEIERLALPLAGYVRKNMDPYSKIEVADESVKIFRTELSVPIEIIEQGGTDGACQKLTIPCQETGRK